MARRDGGEGAGVLPPGGEAEEDRADGVLRGGDGGVAAGVVAAGAGGGRGRGRALDVGPELHLRELLRI